MIERSRICGRRQRERGREKEKREREKQREKEGQRKKERERHMRIVDRGEEKVEEPQQPFFSCQAKSKYLKGIVVS